MPRTLRISLALGIVALLVGGPLWYNSYRVKRYRNFRVVEPGILYRSGQMTVAGLRDVVDTKGIRTVVSLRDGDSRPDQMEEAFCVERGIKYVRIIQKQWSASDKSIPAEEGVDEFLKVMRDPANYPVLVHCFAGHHRTGAYCAIFRMEFNHWPQDRAIREMYDLGYDTIFADWDVCEYLQHYRAKGPGPVGRTVSLPR
ncbi:MAG: dual specificity protein phosphatase family protein [Gemmataceae bacterium]